MDFYENHVRASYRQEVAKYSLASQTSVLFLIVIYLVQEKLSGSKTDEVPSIEKWFENFFFYFDVSGKKQTIDSRENRVM